jgi:hypothetical protein
LSEGFGWLRLADDLVFWFRIMIKAFPRDIERSHGERIMEKEGGGGRWCKRLKMNRVT